MGGVDKGALPVGGRSLGERVGQAVGKADRIVVVGSPCPGATIVIREDPPGGGPVAAIAAGLRHVRAGRVVVLAVDLPFVTAATVAALLDELTAACGAAGVVPVDGTGRDQLLCSAWRTGALRGALDGLGPHHGASVRALAAAVADVHRIQLTGEPPPWFDCDTAEDLDAARRWARMAGDERTRGLDRQGHPPAGH